MKNGELSIRTIDEGAIDKESGMNFSEYIAVLSGDTTLLEKTKVEKKIAVLESLKNVYQKQAAGARYKLESLELRKQTLEETVSNLKSDEVHYKSKLTYNKDGSKQNPIRLNHFQSADAVEIGKYLESLYRGWRPSNQETSQQKIGDLYGFDLYIREGRHLYNNNGSIEYRDGNSFFATRGEGGIKYTYNNGAPSIDNPALTVRHFLNAIDRVGKLHEQYKAELEQVNKDLPVVQTLITQPFEKEGELKSLKVELSELEKDIALKINTNQKHESITEEEELDVPVVKIDRGKKKASSMIVMKTAC